MKLILKWFMSAIALLTVAWLYSGVHIENFSSALWAAAFIGLLNSLVRPVLVLLTLPVTVVTLGLFIFVINALLFWFAAYLLDGFMVGGFWAALLGSLIYSVLSLIVNSFLDLAFSK